MRAEVELIRSREQLRNLTRHLQSAKEEEATQIGREIHDELGQSLTALKMGLSWLDKKLTEEPPPVRERTKVMLGDIDALIKTVKRISTALRPSVLDNLGITAAIEWLVVDFQDRTGIKFELVLRPEDMVLDKERSTAIFRLLQEALVNVTRHANATEVKVSLTEKSGYLKLEVRDDGKGITKEQVFDPKSIGIIGMRERVNILGGVLRISGTQAKGTRVSVSIPVDGGKD